jgi:competence protein ComEA
MRIRKMTYIFLICLVFVFTGCQDKSEPLSFEEVSQVAEEGSTAGSNETKTEVEPPTTQTTPQSNSNIYVQVCGAVHTPGVYTLAAGSRIFQAVDLAGGVTAKADVSALNQAQILTDGQMIYVYTKGETQTEHNQSPSPESTAADGKVNINQATAEQLMALPGIGQAKADSIIAWRTQHGAFEKIEDIMNIEGIKEGVFTKMKDYIKVN